MVDARNALDALIADGYPDVPARDVAQHIFDDLQDDVNDLAAALGQLTPKPVAEVLVIPAGVIEDQ